MIIITIEEIISVIWRSNGMGNDIFSAVIELNKIRQQAYEIYFHSGGIVQQRGIRRRIVSLSRLLIRFRR